VPYELYDNAERDYPTNEFVKEKTEVPNGESFNYLQAIENNIPKPKYKGNKTVGYMFYEEETMTDEMVEALKEYDVIATGSEWNSEIVRKHGVDNVVTVHQGINSDIFKPKNKLFFQDKFIVFSGGKLEPRKGQDIVAYCVGKMQKKYDDFFLITSWENIFNPSDLNQVNIKNMKKYLIPNQTIMTGILKQEELSRYIAETDIGLFPNRCEGGTNLVMMEYMACGKPVIANYATGQKDVLSNHYAYLVEGKTDQELIDECLESLENAYHNREVFPDMGVQARDAMLKFTWKKTADKILEIFNAN